MAVQRTTQPATSELPARYRFTGEQYQRLGEVGILDEDSRVELWDGEVYCMPPIGSWHNSRVNLLAHRLITRFGERAIVSVQGSLRLSDISQPQPDIAVLRYRPDFYINALPGPEDILLIIEVVDSTLAYDRDFKLPRYAQAGIPEVWLVIREAARVEVYRDPAGDSYQSVRASEVGGALTPLAFPDVTVHTGEVIGT